MTHPAYQQSTTRPARSDNRLVFHLEMKQGRPECALEGRDFSVQRAATVLEYSDTANLVKEMYSRRGYSTEGIIGMPRRDSTITLDAHDAEKVMGTLTVRIDTRDTGLLADALYKNEIDGYRGAGGKVCEVSKLAVDPRYGSKELMAALFQMAYLYSHVINHASDAFIEVNPRHAGFYKRMLGFEQVGGLRTCPRVNAPAVLLRIELASMREQIALHAGRGAASREKTLYPYFVNCGAEDWIDRAVLARARR